MRENLAFILFFPALAYLYTLGWEQFWLRPTGSGWLEIIVPSAAMSLALFVWPARPT